MLECRDSLPEKLYTAEAVRHLDATAIKRFAIPGIQLMARAGRVAFARLCERWPQAERLHVFCGTGNNGGDGYIVAALAIERGFEVRLWQVGDAAKLKGDALTSMQRARDAGVEMRAWQSGVELEDGVVVDALLGTGLKGEVREAERAVIAAINASGLPVLAVDIPSGLCSDSGRILGDCVSADCTVTFIGLKRGLFTGQAVDVVGERSFSDLGVPAEVYAHVPASAQRLELDALLAQWPPRPSSAHKGLFGHVLVIGGDYGMAGAVVLAATTAARLGAGLVSCATRPEHIAPVLAACPEVMAHGVQSGQDLQPLLARATAVVIGPGLGQEAWGEQLLQQVARLDVPLVLDADALNLLAAGKLHEPLCRDNWILTPHPGEAARLLNVDTASINADRFSSVSRLQEQYGGSVVLKGAGTLIADGENISLCDRGNAGMASGGMGDVLSGVMGSLLAQRLDISLAARLGVCLHACAGDMAARAGFRGTLAEDLIPRLRELVNSQ